MAFLKESKSKLHQVGIYPFVYQEKALEYMLHRESLGSGGLLVVECGYGKTILGISMVVAGPEKKTIWIVPPNLEQQTYDILKHYLDQMSLHVARLQSPSDGSKLETAAVVLVAHTRLKAFQEVLQNTLFERAIVGES
jgi:superfamily II DNA or RNA helicase